MSCFTTADILVRASNARGECESNLGAYIRALVAAGIVIETPRRSFAGEAPESNGRKVYRLSRDLGEVAPSYSQEKGVMHVNLNKEAS